MASEAILKQKQGVIDEIKDRVQNATTVVLLIVKQKNYVSN